MGRSVQKHINPFVPNATFLYPLKTSENQYRFLLLGGRENVHWEQMGEWHYQTFMIESFSKIVPKMSYLFENCSPSYYYNQTKGMLWMLYVSISQVILLLLKLFLKDCLSTTEAIGNLKNTKKFLHKSGSVSFDLSWMFICRPNIYIIHPSLLLTFIRKKIRIMKKTISIT